MLKAAADTLLDGASQHGPRGTLPLVIEFEDLPGARLHDVELPHHTGVGRHKVPALYLMDAVQSSMASHRHKQACCCGCLARPCKVGVDKIGPAAGALSA